MKYVSVLSVLGGFVVAALGQSTQPASIPIKYELDRDAKVSMLITGPDGEVVRELLHAAPQSKGSQQALWDGLDEAGKPVAAGDYTWKLLGTQGLRAQYLVTVGTNPGQKWEAWPGNHGPVNAVAVDGTGMYGATACGEGTILAFKQTMDGRRLWTIPHWLEAWVGPCSMATDEGVLYMLHLSGKVFRTPTDKAQASGEPWDLAFEEDRKASVFKEVSSIMDLDAGGGQIVVSYARQNLVRWIDPKTGKEIDAAKVDRPFGVAVDKSSGDVLVITGDQVVRLTRQNKQPQVVIPKGQLVGARRLSVDPSSGDILVMENWRVQNWVHYQYFSENHEPPESQRAMTIYHSKGEGFLKDPVPTGGNQVKRFSKSGKFIQAYGSVEGSTQGPHNPKNFNGMWDIAATPEGGFVICEEGLTCRTAMFDKAGECVREWFGGFGYGQHAVADPADTSIVWITDRGRFLKTRVDYATKTWQYLASYQCHEMAQWFDQDGPVWRIVHRGGATYFALIGWQGARSPCMVRLDEASNRMVMCNAGGGDIGQDPQLHIANSTQPLLPEFLKATPKGSWTWNDLNDDGIPSRREISASAWWGHVAGWYMDDDFNWYFHTQDDQLRDVTVYRMPPRSWTRGGNPVYSFDDIRKFAADPGFSESVWGDEQGNVYTSFNHATANDRNFGIGGWSGRAAMNRVAKFDKSGKLQWVVGRHAPGTAAKPGEGHYLIRVVGTTQGCVVVNDMEYGWAHVWDKDGLWVGRFFENPVITPDSPLSAYEQCGEDFGGSVFTDPKTGEVYYIGGGINNCPIYRITGWDQFRRQTGTVTVTPALASTLQMAAKVEATRSDVAHIRYMEENRLKLDGDLSEWKDVKPLLINDGDKAVAKVYLAWNTYFIYAAFDVTTASPWSNSSKAELAFQGGAAVDLNVGPLNPDRVIPQRGNYRVVAAPIGGKTIAAEFYPVLPREFSPPHHRTNTTYKTMVGETVFDRAARMENGRSNAAVKMKPDGSGYVVEMRLMRHEPLEFAPGLRFRFDASVIMADPGGTKSVSRIPWHSRAAADTMTQDTYTEALLRPANWGEAVLE